MKTPIFKTRAQMEELRRKKRKVVSHGTFRAKRHPTSPRLK